MPVRLRERDDRGWSPVDGDETTTLVRRASAGDRAAATHLLTGLAPRVRNLVRYLVRRDRDVDDIAQDALIAILRGLPGYRADGSLTSWADRIVVRVTFASLRRAKADGPLRGLSSLPPADIAGDQVAPDEYVLRRWAVTVLDELPQEQRHAVVLHHLLDLSIPEIAEELGAPFETVRSRLRLARARLRARGVALGKETLSASDFPVSGNDEGLT